MTSFQDAPDEAIEADEAKEVRSMDTIIIHCNDMVESPWSPNTSTTSL